MALFEPLNGLYARTSGQIPVHEGEIGRRPADVPEGGRCIRYRIIFNFILIKSFRYLCHPVCMFAYQNGSVLGLVIMESIHLNHLPTI
jgi:hypothetical protein